MSVTYGIPYQGSKTVIAKDILNSLPSGSRFVDLFGGGFAMSHCCLEEFCTGLFPKYKSVLYNDHNPLLKPLIEKAIGGFYNYDNFKPEWVSRERFFAEKDKDGYIKYIWSFGNNGNTYLYGKNIEEAKRQAHQLIVFGEENELTKGIVLKNKNIRDRRLEFYAYMRNNKERFNLEQLERLERLQRLQRLQQLERLQRLQQLQQLQQLERLEQLQQLELTTMDYHDYEYKDGDVVYCDIPYELSTGKNDYGLNFDFKEFKKWAKSRNFPVYVSSYIDAPIIWQKPKRVTICASNNNIIRQECVYCYN